jgi:hypothetical protein
MNNQIGAILSVLLLIFPSLGAETNSIVGVWRTDEVLSQIGPSVITYSFGPNGGYQSGIKKTQSPMLSLGGNGKYWTTTNQIFMVSNGRTNIALYSFQEGALVIREGDQDVFRLKKDLSQPVPFITNEASASEVQQPKSPNIATTPNLKKLAIKSLATGDTKAATQYAGEWLNNNTNQEAYYYGTTIHDANQILGVAALKEGRVADAKSYLLKAGATRGSPRLNSFGPNMVLAQQLLEKKEGQAVIEYLDLVARFWASSSDEYLRKVEEKTPGGAAVFQQLHKVHQKEIDSWKQEIHAGGRPKLNNSTSLE